MKLPPLQILIALLLGTMYLLLAQPLLRFLCLLAIGGMIFVGLGRILRRYRRERLLIALLGLVGLAAFGAVSLSHPRLQLTYQPDALAKARDVVEYRGFYPEEKDTAGNEYAWTQNRATLVFNFLVHKPITLTLVMRSATVAGGPDAPVHVVVDGVEVGQVQPDPKNPAFQRFNVRFVPADWGGQRTEIKLLAATYEPKGDKRALGTMIQSLSIDRSEAWESVRRWAPLLWALPVLAALALGLAWSAARRPRRAATSGAIAACALGSAGAMTLLLLVLRLGVIDPTVYFVWLACLVYLAGCFAAGAMFLALAGANGTELRRRIGAWAPWQRVIQPLHAVMQRRTAEPAAGTDPRAAILRDLAVVMLVAFSVRVVWAVVNPPWQAPDEDAHYTYTAYIAERGALPHPPFSADPEFPVELQKSSAMSFARELSLTTAGTGTALVPYVPVNHDYRPVRTYDGPPQERLSRSASRAASYPPLYYLLDAIPYRLFEHAPIVTRLFATRCGSALLGALSCVFAYLMAYEVRRERRWGWAVGLCMALMPMYAFITATDNNDVAMDLFATALIWLLARAWPREGLSHRLALAIGVTSGLLLLSKPSGVPVVVVAGIVVLIKLFPLLRTRWPGVRRNAATLGIYAAGVAAMYGPWVLFRYRYYGNVVTIAMTGILRFVARPEHIDAASLPGGAAMRALPIAPLAVTHSFWSYLQYERDLGGKYFYWLFIKSFWGYFGWLDTPMPDRVFIPITVFCLIGVIGFAIQVVLQPARRAALLLLFSLIFAQAFFLLCITNYFLNFRSAGVPLGNQGRYFFPILAPLLMLLLSGWHHLLRERPVALRIAPLLMLVLQLIGLVTILTRYYGIVIG